MDRLAASAYRSGMQTTAHILTFLVLALFAAGSVAQAVSAHAMTVAVASDSHEGADMPACPGCDGEGATTACALACAAPVATQPDEVAGYRALVPVPVQGHPAGMRLPPGLRAAPEPLPPRTRV